MYEFGLRITRENVERFWLGGASHVRGGGTHEVAAPVSQKRVGLKRRPERSMGIVAAGSRSMSGAVGPYEWSALAVCPL